MTTVLAVNGGTKHTADIPPDRLQFVLKLNWATQPFAILALATSKISVALLLLRILGPSAFWRRWFLISSMVLVFIFNSLAAIFSFVQCSPPRALWEKVPDAKCWDPRSQSAFSVFSASHSPSNTNRY